MTEKNSYAAEAIFSLSLGLGTSCLLLAMQALIKSTGLVRLCIVIYIVLHLYGYFNIFRVYNPASPFSSFCAKNGLTRSFLKHIFLYLLAILTFSLLPLLLASESINDSEKLLAFHSVLLLFLFLELFWDRSYRGIVTSEYFTAAESQNVSKEDAGWVLDCTGVVMSFLIICLLYAEYNIAKSSKPGMDLLGMQSTEFSHILDHFLLPSLHCVFLLLICGLIAVFCWKVYRRAPS